VQPNRTKAKRVAVVGFGNIGAAVVKLLRQGQISGLELGKVVVKDRNKPRPFVLPAEMLTADAMQVARDPQIDIVVELMGGTGLAREVVLEALKNGKDVVTANKGIIAGYGHEIFALAAKTGRHVGFRGTFVGCHSLIYELSQARAGVKRIKRVFAVLNGTCNYILWNMTEYGLTFEDALKGAQEKGYAESDPTEDIDGTDTARKTRILVGLISNSIFTSGDFSVEGIKKVTAQDIQYAADLGYSVKLIGLIEHLRENVFYVAVHPVMLPRGSLLGSLEGANNGIEMEDEYEVVSGLVAPGAGQNPTALAVAKDLVDIVDNSRPLMPTGQHKVELDSGRDLERRYYLRLGVADQAGVLAQICNIFWKYNISIAAVIQKEAVTAEFVPLVMTTHMARERDLLEAVKEIDKLDWVKAKTNIIRIMGTERR
jgi:homoserine dehydrogenase